MSPNLSFSIDTLKNISHSFFSELKHAYEGEKSSVPFLVHEIPKPPSIKNDTNIQVMVCGGTIFKTVTFQKKSDQLVQMSDEVEKNTPLFIDKNTFINFIIQELKENIHYLALNFAYPIIPILSHDFLDGMLLHGTKEHVFAGLVGQPIGKTIQKAIFEKIHKQIFITVANDAVCLVLSEANEYNWDKIVGGIVGTGSNYALTLPQNRIVNLECGNFCDFSLSESGRQVDAESINKGQQLIEKEIAGAYLYKHFNYYVKKDKINTPLLTSTRQLSENAENPQCRGSELARLILKRSASLTAAQIAGIHAFKTYLSHKTDFNRSQLISTDSTLRQAQGKPISTDLTDSTGLTNSTDSTDLTFVMEGNLFWHGWKYKETVECTLHALGLHDVIMFTKNEHHSIKGALRLLTESI